MATKESTKNYFLRFPDIKTKMLGKTNFTASVCGFGGYRIHDENATHHLALEKALTSGINLIDTSANYGDGGSERLIGNVVNKLIKEEKIKRDEIIIVSKAGYIQGENLRIVSEKESNGNLIAEVVKCNPDLWHCIHPQFLEDQISRSLNRLNIEKIDVFLLHNPEYFLTYSPISDKDRKEKEYYRRIKESFVHLEKEVEKGRIDFYGISSNSFGENPNKDNFTSLERILDTLSDIQNNHFAVVQFPLNLIESEGVRMKNQLRNKKTFLEIANEANLGVLVNRPLNAIAKNKIIRLADYTVTENRSRKEIDILIEDLEKQENHIKSKYVNFISLPENEKNNLVDCLSLASILKNNFNRFDSLNQFNEIKGYYFVPRANYAVKLIEKNYENDDSMLRDLRNYAVTINIILDSIGSLLASEKNEANKIIHSAINDYLNSEQQKLTLSQKSILLINSISQVTTTLVGMRNNNYVQDVLISSKMYNTEENQRFWHENSKIF